jgi:hypothetical protein
MSALVIASVFLFQLLRSLPAEDPRSGGVSVVAKTPSAFLADSAKFKMAFQTT